MKKIISIVPLFLFLAQNVNALSYSETIVADGPISYWRFGEKNPSDPAVDVTGKNDGEYANGVALRESGALENDSDTAATFDGIKQYVVARNPFFGTGTTNFSFEFWMKTTMFGG